MGIPTANLGLTKPMHGEMNWDAAMNSNLDAIDELFSGGAGKIDNARLPIDTDVELAADSDSKIASQKAVKAAIEAAVAGAGAVSSVDAATGAVKLLHPVEFQLNDVTALTTSARAPMRVPLKFNGMNLVSVAANLGVASSSGNPTFTVKKNGTSMLSTNLTVDSGETDSSTAATAAVIDTAHDDVATGDRILVECTVAGTGVQEAIVELTFQLP